MTATTSLRGRHIEILRGLLAEARGGELLLETHEYEALDYAIAALSTPPAGEWMPIASAPKDGTYLVANVKGQVAPWINGVIHNNVGTAHDWHFGEAATRWQPLPPPPEPATQEVG